MRIAGLAGLLARCRHVAEVSSASIELSPADVEIELVGLDQPGIVGRRRGPGAVLSRAGHGRDPGPAGGPAGPAAICCSSSVSR
ncbi:MAG TPA: hypothetical protein VK586_16390, partial [Streptosporangiaceae bacterium]|nr:hypothetical protein [Streptosporangiaceae bacterium]